MEFPEDLKYTTEHEWLRVQGDTALVGITDYAQEQLGDIVFVELPDVGGVLKQGDSFGVVESTKSVSDLYAPISGEILETNDTLLDTPDLLNEDPYGEGWIIKLKMSSSKELSQLLDAESYEQHIEEST